MTDISVATGPWESTDVARHCAAIKTMFDRATAKATTLGGGAS